MTDLQALSDAATPAEKWGGVQTWENILRSWIGPTGNRSAARADAALIVAAVNHVRETLRAATPVVPDAGFAEADALQRPLAASPSPDTDREHTITIPVSKLDELVREVARRESPDTGAGLDVRRMTVAIERELHLDEAHGFPPGFTARELALHLADHYDHAPVEEPVR